jgi:hypothetical protein
MVPKLARETKVEEDARTFKPWRFSSLCPPSPPAPALDPHNQNGFPNTLSARTARRWRPVRSRILVRDRAVECFTLPNGVSRRGPNFTVGIGQGICKNGSCFLRAQNNPSTSALRARITGSVSDSNLTNSGKAGLAADPRSIKASCAVYA